MKNVILIGFMGSGKSTAGKLLADRLEFQWIDMDDLIEADTGKVIKDIFSEEGEDYFRQLETKQLKLLSQKQGIVISTGGGVVLREENRLLLKEIGTVVFLHANCDQLMKNLKEDTERPLLQKGDLQEKILNLLDEREPAYLNSADMIVQTSGKSLENVVEEIISLL